MTSVCKYDDLFVILIQNDSSNIMKKLLSVLKICILLFMATSCYRAPEFPTEPNISFESLLFYDTPDVDSLVIGINFEDGDGNLGISGSENNPPYHPYSFIRGSNGEFLTISSNDTMPPYSPPYSCLNYQLGKFANNNFYIYKTQEYNNLFPGTNPNTPQPPDTFYTKPNPYTDNFLVDYYVKRDGSYQLFDWVTAPTPSCGESMNGRFKPLYDSDNPDKPLSGQIYYSMINRGFIPYFRNDTVKLRVRVIDRMLNESNVIETPEFYFSKEGDRYQIELLE